MWHDFLIFCVGWERRICHGWIYLRRYRYDSLLMLMFWKIAVHLSFMVSSIVLLFCILSMTKCMSFFVSAINILFSTSNTRSGCNGMILRDSNEAYFLLLDYLWWTFVSNQLSEAVKMNLENVECQPIIMRQLTYNSHLVGNYKMYVRALGYFFPF